MSRLSQYFSGIAVKRLSAVEANPEVSNQHEFNGVKEMADIFGREKITMPCNYLYLGDTEEKTIEEKGTMTWYDARIRHPTRTEYRLYFQGNSVTEQASEGDLLVIGKRPNGNALALIVKQGSTHERQILWLFGIEKELKNFSFSTLEGANNKEIGFAERTVIEAIGIEVTTPETGWLEIIVKKFGLSFPSTRLFSAFARETTHGVSSVEEPDQTLLAWINHEEILFRTLERKIVQERLDKGFEKVDDFVEFSLSVHNRRKSRVGFALENHLEQIFQDNKITFSRGQITENKAKPDFIFPEIQKYRDINFPASKLTMLGAKSTCKDRWRQVLSEAKRIEEKHLFTLEPGISLNQTEEMRDNRLQLILPKELHVSYLPEQQNWLMDLSDFINLVLDKQH